MKAPIGDIDQKIRVDDFVGNFGSLEKGGPAISA